LIPGETRSRNVPFAQALRFWVKLGWISFGGPAGQIAVMHRELVERRRYLSEDRFLHALNYCMMLPGPEATQLAIYVGWLLHRTPGGIVAGAFFVIPSILVLLVLSYVYAAHGNTGVVSGLLSGFKPVVVAIVVEAVLKIGRRALKRRAHFLIAAASFFSIYFLRAPFPVIVLLAALVGFAGARLWPSAFVPEAKPDGSGKARADEKNADEKNAGEHVDGGEKLPLVIDDDAPPPPHTLPSRRRALKVLAVGFALWLAPLALLVLWQGASGLHSQEYFFFTKAALVTFGGAYAVLAYVTQAVTVAPFHWLSPAQAVDGLALAETTPGPLIMVLQFVGFMAGWNDPPAGLNPVAGGVVGALVTTYVTFLPCFVFIFLGAPYIEVLRGKRALAGALAGVTAAVVGVILNLALVFGAAVIFPQGVDGEVNWFAAFLSVAAFVALSRLKLDVLWVVLAGGLLGLARAFLYG
jgi:chromate transporter